MADDIVTRLRCNPCDCDGTCYTCQAADEIERLRAERADLQVLLRGRTAEFQAEIERLQAEIERLRAEVERKCVQCVDETTHQAKEIIALRAERDAERALADRLARSLLDGAFRSNRYYRMHGPSWVEVHGALDAYEEARRG